MKQIYSLLFVCIFFTEAYTQDPKSMVHAFFTKMRKSDTIGLRALFTENPSFYSASSDKLGKDIISKGGIEDFIKTLPKYKAGDLDERISNLEVDLFEKIATVKMDYTFYFKNTFSHRGINIFHFLKDAAGWKITGIDDTRIAKDNTADVKKQASKILDNWHLAAAKADSASYFDIMHERSIFIGTDSSEVWTKPQFLDYSAPHFRRGKAWSFKVLNRNLHIEENMQMIWFDEVLDTRFGQCRGSGFMVVEDDGSMKIMQYVLSLIVPNDDMDKVTKIVKKGR